MAQHSVSPGCIIHLYPFFSHSSAGLPPIVSTVINSSMEAPMVRMRILDEDLQRDATLTKLGQKLILKIEIIPSNGKGQNFYRKPPHEVKIVHICQIEPLISGPYDIFAGHLVASSANGDSSYLLLDEMGCPTDSGTFPALLRDTDNSSLVAKFTAFKFPNSQLVRFNVVVKFCTGRCEPVGIPSLHRIASVLLPKKLIR